ncbi:hypothetical protein Ssi03_11770 [Sphaerisporangium siamense]|uniref:Ketosteroid isomerase-like protein n=1 Tax=Sphaerisporangium siamense TaxID=795645 RepID=A0A7W7DA30_9ACTN|nr:ester cyclase [Sphaerisporangium siamense]MBB4703047.1 ketosteroid isomerase-like protein [Sphaerisporangium siamense]GII83187.1 hypothetical protein Ssi03_11770 [Sphaerisporangium siamense]
MPDASEIMNRVTDGFNRHDLEALTRCFDARGVFVTPSGVGDGLEEITYFFESSLTAFPDAVVTLWSTVTCGDTAIGEWTVTGTHGGAYMLPGGDVVTATGRPIAIRGASFCTVDEDGVVGYRIYYDQLELIAQLGRTVGAEREF